MTEKQLRGKLMEWWRMPLSLSCCYECLLSSNAERLLLGNLILFINKHQKNCKFIWRYPIFPADANERWLRRRNLQVPRGVLLQQLTKRRGISKSRNNRDSHTRFGMTKLPPPPGTPSLKSGRVVVLRGLRQGSIINESQKKRIDRDISHTFETTSTRKLQALSFYICTVIDSFCCSQPKRCDLQPHCA